MTDVTSSTFVQKIFQAVLNAFLIMGQTFLFRHFNRNLELTTRTLFTFLKGASCASSKGKEIISVGDIFPTGKKKKFCGENACQELKALVGIYYKFGLGDVLCDGRRV